MFLNLLCIGGARPNFMKLAPLVHALGADPDFSVLIVHTGQHYDDQMSGMFFRDLEIPRPDFHLGVGSGSHATQTAEIMKRVEPVMLETCPDAIIVVGDVNSTLAAALVAAKLGIPVVHIESGLRSFDRSMPEEINRIVTDALSSLHFVTEPSAFRNLLAEGVPAESIRYVGNLMIDSLYRKLSSAREAGTRQRLGISAAPFALLTLHRPSNVDDPCKLRDILYVLAEISQTLPVYFPVHPRTREAIKRDGLLPGADIHFLEPLGYLDFLCLMSQSALVLTDSGGIQEETTALGVPCLTLRDTTERPITIEQGSNTLAGTTRESILNAWKHHQKGPKVGRIPPLWDGRAAERCREVLKSIDLRGLVHCPSDLVKLVSDRGTLVS
jgi:UDP-N-acetylglucosamine 2-epimerase (non-hydrolysing)